MCVSVSVRMHVCSQMAKPNQPPPPLDGSEPQDLSDDSFEVSDHFPLPEIVNSPVMGLTIGNASWNFSDGQGVKATFLDYFGSEMYVIRLVF